MKLCIALVSLHELSELGNHVPDEVAPAQPACFHTDSHYWLEQRAFLKLHPQTYFASAATCASYHAGGIHSWLVIKAAREHIQYHVPAVLPVAGTGHRKPRQLGVRQQQAISSLASALPDRQ